MHEQPTWPELLRQPGARLVYRLTYLFTTQNGRWDPVAPDKAPYGIEQLYRDLFLKPPNHPAYCQTCGGDHHLFQMVYTEMPPNYKPIPSIHTYHWRASNPWSPNWTPDKFVTPLFGWTNLAMFASSAYWPQQGQHGPWSISANTIGSDIVRGVGLPEQWHVSTFAAYQAITLDAYRDLIGEGPPVEPGTLEDFLLRTAAQKQVLKLNPDAALQKVILSHGFIPTSEEFDINHLGTSYTAQRAEQLSTGIVRVYYVVKGDWANVQYVTRP